MSRSTSRHVASALLSVGLLLAVSAVVEAQSPEGVEVHGHWKLEFLEPDGTVVRTTEFENALQSGGAEQIAALLSRGGSQGSWTVNFDGTPSVCASGSCAIVEPGFNGPSDNLALSVNAGAFVLSGSLVAEQDGTITGVFTQTGYCAGSATPADCGTLGGPPSTATSFSFAGGLSESAVAGQIIQVSVTYTFS